MKAPITAAREFEAERIPVRELQVGAACGLKQQRAVSRTHSSSVVRLAARRGVRLDQVGTRVS